MKRIVLYSIRKYRGLLLPCRAVRFVSFLVLLFVTSSLFGQQKQAYDLFDPRNPDCPCHQYQQQAEKEYQQLHGGEQKTKETASLVTPGNKRRGNVVTLASGGGRKMPYKWKRKFGSNHPAGIKKIKKRHKWKLKKKPNEICFHF